MTVEVTPRDLKKIVSSRLDERRLVLFLDYDGTLTPIVERPELAKLDNETRRVLECLVETHPVYVISGRDLNDVRELVDIDRIHFVGSHGFHMIGGVPGVDQSILDAALPELESAAAELESRLSKIDGVLIERKKFSFALHYRLVEPDKQEQVKSIAQSVLRNKAALASKGGKKVVEFVPAIPWDKGKCISALRSRIRETMGDEAIYAVYIGDDLTDEDAFRVLYGNIGLGVVVADEPRKSAAEFRLRDPSAVKQFLKEFA